MKRPISSMAGVAVIVIYCVFTFASWALYPTAYSPVTNWLSDLGQLNQQPKGRDPLQLGLYSDRNSTFPFFIGLYEWYKDKNRFRWGFMVWQKPQRLCGRFFIDHDRRFFSRLRMASQVVVYSFLHTHSGSFHRTWVSPVTDPRYIRTIAYYGFIVAAIDVMFIFFDAPSLEWFTVFSALG